MTIRKLDRNQWKPFCDRVSKGLQGRLAEVQILSPALGVQNEATWLPLIGLVYDPKRDVMEIALDGIDHLIENPSELYADESAGGLANMEVIGTEGVRQIVTFRDPLMLPAPQAM